MRKLFGRKRFVLPLVAAVAAALAVGSVAIAGSMNGDGNITACLYHGLIIKAKKGDDPKRPCKAKYGQQEVSWALGDHSNGVAPTTYALTKFVTLPAGEIRDNLVNCDAGDVATGGGAQSGISAVTWRSQPNPSTGTPTGWLASFLSQSTGPLSPSTYVVCLDFPPAHVPS